MKIILLLLFSTKLYAQQITGLRAVALSKGKITADAFVQGSYTVDPTCKAVALKWYKVSGTKSTISTPDSASTKIVGLSKGIYNFGFIVKDLTHNLADTDYLKITVY